MPKSNALPAELRCYSFHGIDLNWEGKEWATAECPFCLHDKELLHVEVTTGLWSCKTCPDGGNPIQFLRKLWENGYERTKGYEELAAIRNPIRPDTLEMWGVYKSPITREWVVPGYGPNGKLDQLYRYVYNYRNDKHILLATTGFNHGLFGVPLFQGHPTVYIAEGPWDGMALWQAFREAGTKADVIAVPGCSTWNNYWTALLSNKQVVFMYDNDHPRENNGKTVSGAGITAMRKLAKSLDQSNDRPESISYLKWGEDGYDRKLPDHYDIRDWLCGKGTNADLVSRLLARVAPIPPEWSVQRVPDSGQKAADLACLECNRWLLLIDSWKEAMQWTEGLDRAFSVMLAAVASTMCVGDQLWVKIVSPPSTGKSTLCEALDVAKRYVMSKSTIRGFHSGYMSEATGKEDNSLIAKLYGKTLVTKDGDTLIQSPNLSQILSEARDIYDGTGRTHYRNKMGRDYVGIRMTWILCGTPSLRVIDSSELGERFLDCQIMDQIDDQLEDEVLWRVVNRTATCMNYEANGKMESQYEPSLAKAMRLTGGYIEYLRENANELFCKVECSESSLRYCMQLGKFVAYMRARPASRVGRDPRQDESAEREFASRLASQLVRLAKSLAIVLNRKLLDNEVMRRVRAVALDTARGRTVEIMKFLYQSAEKGATTLNLAVLENKTEEKEELYLNFLHKIGAIERFNYSTSEYVVGSQRWKLSKRMTNLYREVYGIEEVEAESETEDIGSGLIL